MEDPEKAAIHQREFANVFTRFGALIIDGLIMVPFYIPLYFAGRDLEYGMDVPESYIWLFFITILAMLIFGVWNTIIRMGNVILLL